MSPVAKLFISAMALPVAFSALAQQPDTTDLTQDGAFTQGVEGPVVDAKGNLYAVNYARQGTIGRITPEGTQSLWLSLEEGSVVNGLRFNSKGMMLAADYTRHKVLQIDPVTLEFSVLAHQSKMHQPNDIAVTGSDIVFASDPNWAESTGQLWQIDHNGQTKLIEDNMGTTNGVEVCQNDSVLYVNESVQRKVWRYKLDSHGNPTDKSLFYQFDDFGLDGMRCDSENNLYIARYGAGIVAVLSPAGELLNEIQLKGTFPTNVAFGGEDGKTLYITMQKRGAIETTRVKYPGRAWVMLQKQPSH